MPIYEYKCKKCKNEFEHLARTLSDTPSECPKCGAKAPEKQLSGFSVNTKFHVPSCKTGGCPVAGSPGGCSGGGCPLG